MVVVFVICHRPLFCSCSSHVATGTVRRPPWGCGSFVIAVSVSMHGSSTHSSASCGWGASRVMGETILAGLSGAFPVVTVLLSFLMNPLLPPLLPLCTTRRPAAERNCCRCRCWTFCRCLAAVVNCATAASVDCCVFFLPLRLMLLPLLPLQLLLACCCRCYCRQCSRCCNCFCCCCCRCCFS